MMMGTNAFGTDCEWDRLDKVSVPCIGAGNERLTLVLVCATHGDFDDALGLFEHRLEQGVELFALDVARDDEEGIDI